MYLQVACTSRLTRYLLGGRNLRSDSGVKFRVQRIAPPGDAVTWTVLDDGHRVVGPAEELLQFLRVQGNLADYGEVVRAGARVVVGYLHAFGLGLGQAVDR